MSISTTLTVNGVKRTIELDDPRVTARSSARAPAFDRNEEGLRPRAVQRLHVLVDGRRINSCLALAVSHDGADVRTIEGVARGDGLHPVQEAFLAHDGLQCGFCTPADHERDRAHPGGAGRRRSGARARGHERKPAAAPPIRE